MDTQQSKLLLTHQAALGVLLLITDNRGREVPLAATHDHLAHLKPGDTLTITATADERWEARPREIAEEEKRKSNPTDLDAKAAGDIASRPDLGQDLSQAGVSANTDGQEAAADSASIAGLPGATTVDEGATTRTTRPSKSR